MVLESDLSLVSKTDRLLRWGHWFTFFNILVALVITASYYFADPLPASLVGWSYLLLNWIGHTAFLCFLFFILTIFPISLIFPIQRHVRGVAAVLATLGLVILIFDSYVYHQLGYHAGSASYEQTLGLLRQQVVTNLRNFILITSTVAALLFVLQLTLSNYCWKKIARLSHSGMGKPILTVLLSCFVASHLMHIWADARQIEEITRQDNVLPLTYPATARTMLSRYDLIDAAPDSQLPNSAWLSLHTKPMTLSCQLSAESPSVHIWVVDNTKAQHIPAEKPSGLRELSPHMVPTDPATAWQNLWYGRFYQPKTDANTTNLTDNSHTETSGTEESTGHWLTQLPLHSWSLQASPDWQSRFPELTKFQTTEAASSTKMHWHFVDHMADVATALAQIDPNSIVLVVPFTANAEKFTLQPMNIWYRWPTLHQVRSHDVSQHLDIVPTLLHQIGCHSQQAWHGDNLLQPPPRAKLNIVGDQLYMFRKDKMQIIDQDGRYSIWSAGTGVRLEQELDLPLLTDALNRLTDHEGKD